MTELDKEQEWSKQVADLLRKVIHEETHDQAKL